MRRHTARSGFTLVELAIVLAIMGLIAGMAAPRYAAAAARYRLKAAAHRIAMDLTQARAAARASSTSVTVTFFPGGLNQYSMTGGAGYFVASTVNIGQDPYSVSLKDASFNASTSVVFDGYGNAKDGDVTVVSGTLIGTVHFDNSSGRSSTTISAR